MFKSSPTLHVFSGEIRELLGMVYQGATWHSILAAPNEVLVKPIMELANMKKEATTFGTSPLQLEMLDRQVDELVW